jgi:hypothetical protein
MSKTELLHWGSLMSVSACSNKCQEYKGQTNVNVSTDIQTKEIDVWPLRDHVTAF